MRFLADAMLGKLAEWLRLLGYDTVSAADLPFVDDDYLLDIAEDEGRVLLTKDKELYQRAKKEGVEAVLVEGKDVEEQLAFLVKKGLIELREVPSLERCPRCNGLLRRASKEEVKGQVPVGVYMSHEEFWICTNCGQIYWKGSHWKRMKEFVERVKALI
ncbi:MAG: hypothetical protein GXO00_02650 [Candidatus Diapherotrites archaeon]|nr:hypothetical protein [Candidatus Diapherotrites archaeon]